LYSTDIYWYPQWQNTPSKYINGNKVVSAGQIIGIASSLMHMMRMRVVYGKPPNNIPSKYNFVEGS